MPWRFTKAIRKPSRWKRIAGSSCRSRGRRRTACWRWPPPALLPWTPFPSVAWGVGMVRPGHERAHRDFRRPARPCRRRRGPAQNRPAPTPPRPNSPPSAPRARTGGAPCASRVPDAPVMAPSARTGNGPRCEARRCGPPFVLAACSLTRTRSHADCHCERSAAIMLALPPGSLLEPRLLHEPWHQSEIQPGGHAS